MESNSEGGERVNLGIGDKTNFKLIGEHLDKNKAKYEVQEVVLCFVDGDNMGSWNNYLGLSPTDKLFEVAYQ